MKLMQSYFNLKKSLENPAFKAALVNPFRVNVCQPVTGYTALLNQVCVGKSNIRIGIFYKQFVSEISLNRISRRLRRSALAVDVLLVRCLFAQRTL